MKDWIRIDNKSFRDVTPKVEKKPGGGTQIRMMMSPHAMPIAVRALVVREGKGFRIEFRYIDQERVAKQELQDGVLVEYGKNSHRIHAIELPEHMVDEGFVELKMSIEKVTESFGNSFHKTRSNLLNDNLLSARSSINQVGEQLLNSPGDAKYAT
jgi:hypothetical protein